MVARMLYEMCEKPAKFTANIGPKSQKPAVQPGQTDPIQGGHVLGLELDVRPGWQATVLAAL